MQDNYMLPWGNSRNYQSLIDIIRISLLSFSLHYFYGFHTPPTSPQLCSLNEIKLYCSSDFRITEKPSFHLEI